MQPLLHKIAKKAPFLDPGSMQVVASCSLMAVCTHFCTSTRAVNRASITKLVTGKWKEGITRASSSQLDQLDAQSSVVAKCDSFMAEFLD